VYCIDPEGFWIDTERGVAMKVNLNTVAAAVGVSRSTVSNAYSRPDQLSAELRSRILDTARELGYPGPDPTARSLRRGRAGAIGVLFTADLSHAFTDPYAVRFLRGVAQAAQGQHRGILLVPVGTDDPERATRMVLDAMVDGFCVYCVPDWHPCLSAIRSRDLPLVETERRPDAGPETMYVAIDEAAAAHAAGVHLLGLGHRRVGFVGEWVVAEKRTRRVAVGDVDAVASHVSRERLRGYHRAFGEAGLDPAGLSVVNVAVNGRAEGAAAAELLLDGSPRPTAIVTTTDVIALGVLDTLAARGLVAGRDVSVVGFDDIPEAGTANLTTVRQPALEKGRIVGELLLDAPADRTARQVLLPTQLMVRNSTGPVSSGRT
jgi:DNA-binding LacI/PurR family transcriptional regulator